MNRIFFLIILLVYSFVNSNAQKIYVDRIENDGRRQIMTVTKNFSINGAEYYIGMKVFETSYSKDWLLLISSFYYIPNSSEILLKLGNDEIIYLPVNNVNVGKVAEADYYSSVYELSKTNMDKIDSYGITKIRISNGVEFRDKTYKNNSLGKFLTKCRKNIKNRLEEPMKSKGLFDNF